MNPDIRSASISARRLLLCQSGSNPCAASERDAFWLVAHTTGVSGNPYFYGALLYDAIDDSAPDLGNPGESFRERMRALTVTQDWALRLTLSRFHNLCSEKRSVTLRDVGFPVTD